MSNIAKQPVKIKEGVTVTLQDGKVSVTGPKGTLEEKVPAGVRIVIEDAQVKVSTDPKAIDQAKFGGLTRALIANMVNGVTAGFAKQLELTGVGYRARVEGQDLILNVGFSVPVRVKPRQGVTISVDENNIITVLGSSKQLVGDTAVEIRSVRPPDPYKGKGIKYVGELLRRKVGKAAKAVGTK